MVGTKGLTFSTTRVMPLRNSNCMVFVIWLIVHTLFDLLLLERANIFIRFGTKLYRQVVGIPMGTNCAPLVADLFLFCYERDFMMSLSDDK